MIAGFEAQSTEDLYQLAGALRSGRLTPPYPIVALRRYVGDPRAGRLHDGFRRLAEDGFTPRQIARLLETLASDRSSRPPRGDAIDLVWTGPEAEGVANRDTAVVVRELFRTARSSVLVAGYAVHQGRSVFKALADRMDACPGLSVRMFLDVHPHPRDGAAPTQAVEQFARRFVAHEWPGQRLPEVYYAPRSLEAAPGKRACLHAKCVVEDGETAFISSANFTEAAQTRNVEVGVLIRSPSFAMHLARHFEALAAGGHFRRVPLG